MDGVAALGQIMRRVEEDTSQVCCCGQHHLVVRIPDGQWQHYEAKNKFSTTDYCVLKVYREGESARMKLWNTNIKQSWLAPLDMLLHGNIVSRVPARELPPIDVTVESERFAAHVSGLEGHGEVVVTEKHLPVCLSLVMASVSPDRITAVGAPISHQLAVLGTALQGTKFVANTTVEKYIAAHPEVVAVYQE